MRSIADELRAQTRTRVLDLPVLARIALALSLGDEDLELFVRVSGLTTDVARARLCAQRARGRRVPSASAGRR